MRMSSSSRVSSSGSSSSQVCATSMSSASAASSVSESPWWAAAYSMLVPLDPGHDAREQVAAAVRRRLSLLEDLGVGERRLADTGGGVGHERDPEDLEPGVAGGDGLARRGHPHE